MSKIEQIRERLEWAEKWDRAGCNDPPTPKPDHMRAGWAVKDIRTLLDEFEKLQEKYDEIDWPL